MTETSTAANKSAAAATRKGRTRPAKARAAQGNRVPGTRAYRAWMIAEYYEGEGVPAWVAIAEEVLRDWTQANRISVRHLPRERETKQAEMATHHFFMWIVAWTWEDDERLSADRLYDEAVRRLRSKRWFVGTAGDMSYLRLWAEGVIWGNRNVTRSPAVPHSVSCAASDD